MTSRNTETARQTSKYSTKANTWARDTENYTSIERVTRGPCEVLVDWVNYMSPLVGSSVAAFDLGCGSGILTRCLKAKFPLVPILATDISGGMVHLVRRIVSTHGWTDVSTGVLDATCLRGIEDNSFSHVFSTFMITSTPDPHAVAQQMYRVTNGGGVVGLATWSGNKVGWCKPWEKACRAIDPSYTCPQMSEPEFGTVESVRRGLEQAGFQDIQVKLVRSKWAWECPEKCYQYFFESNNPALDKLKGPWEESGRMDEVRPLFERILREEYGNCTDVEETAILAVARKPVRSQRQILY